MNRYYLDLTFDILDDVVSHNGFINLKYVLNKDLDTLNNDLKNILENPWVSNPNDMYDLLKKFVDDKFCWPLSNEECIIITNKAFYHRMRLVKVNILNKREM